MLRRFGFTLSEVLAVLLLLGVISSYTIPKILYASGQGQFNAIAKESMAMISEAYTQIRYENNGLVPLTTIGEDVMNRTNNLGVDASAAIDTITGFGASTIACNTAGYACYRLHNGALMGVHTQASVGTACTLGKYNFGGANAYNAINFLLDPDGKVSNRQDSLSIWLYYNGKITTAAKIIPNTQRADCDTTIFTFTPVEPTWLKL